MAVGAETGKGEAMRIGIGIAALLLLAGCGQAPEPKVEAPAMPLPRKMCDDARASLEALRAQAAIEYDEAGAATVYQQAWLQVSVPEREAIATALAVVAACAAPEPVREQEVTITSEMGTVVMRRTVELSADPALLFAD